eukprot:g13121.t1
MVGASRRLTLACAANFLGVPSSALAPYWVDPQAQLELGQQFWGAENLVSQLQLGEPQPLEVDRFLTREKSAEAMARVADRRPFMWAHWGDSDFMVLVDRRTANNPEGAFYNDRCLANGLAHLLTGDLDGARKKQAMLDVNGTQQRYDTPIVYNALGLFFIRRGGRLMSQTNRFFAELGKIPGFRFPHPVFDGFYLSPGQAIFQRDTASFGIVNHVLARGLPVAVVGAEHMRRGLRCMLKRNYVAFFEVSKKFHACDDRPRLLGEIVGWARARTDHTIFLVAGSAPGKIIAYEAYRELEGTHTFIDVGASLDLFAGVQNRDFNRGSRALHHCSESMPWFSVEACARICTSAGQTSRAGGCCSQAEEEASTPEDFFDFSLGAATKFSAGLHLGGSARLVEDTEVIEVGEFAQMLVEVPKSSLLRSEPGDE